MICDVTLMYSPKLFFYFNGSETDWVDFLTIIYPAKKTWISTHALLFGVIALDSRCCLLQPKALMLLISPICAFEVFLKGDNL